jgi:hypothetical protein
VRVTRVNEQCVDVDEWCGKLCISDQCCVS